MAQPSGKDSFRFRFTRTFPSATTLVAMSTEIATVPFGPGTATASGFVESRRPIPPYGTTDTAVGALVHTKPTKPRSAAISA